MPRQRPLLRAEAAGALLLAALAVVPDAHAWDLDEVRDLRVAREGSGVRLTWQPPAAGADTYIVRRCALPSVQLPFYGLCIAEGVVLFQHDDPAPVGDVFYLVSGVVGSTEGSLGRADNGVTPPRRQADPCGPQSPSTLSVHVDVEEPMQVCGTRVVVRYPAGVITFVSATCIGLAAGYLPETNAEEPGEIQHACVDGQGQDGDGPITRLQFEQGECLLSARSLRLVTCEVIDCDGNTREALCSLQ